MCAFLFSIARISTLVASRWVVCSRWEIESATLVYSSDAMFINKTSPHKLRVGDSGMYMGLRYLMYHIEQMSDMSLDSCHSCLLMEETS
jgi:hypothetical protein